MSGKLQPQIRTKAPVVDTSFFLPKNKIDEKVSHQVKLAATDSCFGFIRPRQHGIANKMAHGFPHKNENGQLWDWAMMAQFFITSFFW